MMRGSTYFRYAGGRACAVIFILTAAFAAIIAFVDLAESLRFVGKYAKDNFQLALAVTLLRTPSVLHALLPFVVLFGSIWLFAQMNRRAELAVLRSAGLSIWSLTAPVAFAAAAVGVISVLVVDPAASRLLAHSERLKAEAQGRPGSLMRVFGDGIWLRHRDADNILIINAASVDPERAVFASVTIWRLDAESRFLERVDAPEARLAGRTIELHKARIKTAGQQFDFRTPVYAIATRLTASDLRERLSLPETVSIWSLPRFILLAEAAGLPTASYDMRFHALCATPLKLVAMVLIAAMFSMRPIRGGGVFLLFGAAIGSGFALYFLSEAASAVGLSGLAPIALSAWIPAVAATVIAVAGLLYLEEG